MTAISRSENRLGMFRASARVISFMPVLPYWKRFGERSVSQHSCGPWNQKIGLNDVCPTWGKMILCNPRAIISLASFEEPKLMSSVVTTSLVRRDFHIDNLASHSIKGEWLVFLTGCCKQQLALHYGSQSRYRMKVLKLLAFHRCISNFMMQCMCQAPLFSLATFFTDDLWWLIHWKLRRTYTFNPMLLV